MTDPESPTVTVNNLIENNKVAIFSKTYCPFCTKVKTLFDGLQEAYATLELDLLGEEGTEIQKVLELKTKQRTFPNVFINKIHVGGCDATLAAHEDGSLADLLAGISYDFDLIVVGGGSGGLAASKEAAILGKKVLVCDFVTPSPKGTTWGLGGTCVNVGCIPKKLMHKAAIIGSDIKDAHHFGWILPEPVEHNWSEMVTNIQNYIKSLNFGYRKALREKSVEYRNSFVKFIDTHEVELTNKAGKSETVTSKHFIIACGGRPNYPEIPGAVEYGITSDDLFSLTHHPGKCLIVGASYIALECAGFLHGLGIDCTVMVRSILLRGFDQQIAEMVGSHMQSLGIKFIRPCVPVQVEEINEGELGLYKVTSHMLDSDKIIVEEYNTVLFAVGRTACTEPLNLDVIGVAVNQRTKKIMVNNKEESSIDNIFAIGDVIDGKLELTPVAIQAGQLLARRLNGKTDTLMDYQNVPTTVFTPLEYGFVGLSEEDAIEKYGSCDVEAYHSFYNPLEFALPKRDENKCYAKLVCIKSEQERVVGLHILGPNAGEITQGFALGVKLGAKKLDFHNLVGIHPTDAEIFTTMNIAKSTGQSVLKTDC